MLEIVCQVLARDAARRRVVDGEIDQRPLGARVDADDRDTGIERFLDRRRDRLGVGGIDKDDVGTRGDHRIDGSDLLVEIVVMGDDIDRSHPARSS